MLANPFLGISGLLDDFPVTGKLGKLRHLRPKPAAKGGNHDFSAWNGQVWMAIHQFQRTEKDDTYKGKDCSFTLVPLIWKTCSSLPPGISTKCQWFILAFVNDKSHPNINTPGFRMWFHPLNSKVSWGCLRAELHGIHELFPAALCCRHQTGRCQSLWYPRSWCRRWWRTQISPPDLICAGGKTMP